MGCLGRRHRDFLWPTRRVVLAAVQVDTLAIAVAGVRDGAASWVRAVSDAELGVPGCRFVVYVVHVVDGGKATGEPVGGRVQQGRERRGSGRKTTNRGSHHT